jgi:hypothetical protein
MGISHTFLESLCVIKSVLVLETVVVKLFEKSWLERGAFANADLLEGSADAIIHSELGVGLAHFSISQTAACVIIEIGARVGAHVHQAKHAADKCTALLAGAHIF